MDRNRKSHYSSEERNYNKTYKTDINSNLLNELCSISSENKELKECLSQMKKTIEQNEKKVKTLEYKVIDNIDIRGKVTNTAFCGLEQKYCSQNEKLTELQTEVTLLKNEKSNIFPENRLKSLEDEVCKLKINFNELYIKEVSHLASTEIIKPKSSIVGETKPQADSEESNKDILLDLYERMIIDKAEQNLKSEIKLYILKVKANYLKFEELEKDADFTEIIKNYKFIFSLLKIGSKTTYYVEKALDGFDLYTWFEGILSNVSYNSKSNIADICNFEYIYTLCFENNRIEFTRKKSGVNMKLSFYFVAMDTKPCFIYIKNSNFIPKPTNLKKRANDYSGKKRRAYNDEDKENDPFYNIVIPNPFDFEKTKY
jgi:hypothetical protein